jgi:hypothetical protein
MVAYEELQGLLGITDNHRVNSPANDKKLVIMLHIVIKNQEEIFGVSFTRFIPSIQEMAL